MLSGTLSVSVSATGGSDIACGGTGECEGSMATAGITLTINVATAGPARMGEMIYTDNEVLGPNFGASSTVVGSVDDTLLSFGRISPVVIPLELGGITTLSLVVGAITQFDGDSNPSLTFSGAVYEADGVTPVTLIDAPEPMTPILMIIGFGSIIALSRVPRRRSTCGRKTAPTGLCKSSSF
jgi:hypothetical protein